MGETRAGRDMLETNQTSARNGSARSLFELDVHILWRANGLHMQAFFANIQSSIQAKLKMIPKLN